MIINAMCQLVVVHELLRLNIVLGCLNVFMKIFEWFDLVIKLALPIHWRLEFMKGVKLRKEQFPLFSSLLA